MNYAYDILVNFLDGNRVYEFFEWKKEDKVKNINRTPLFLIKSDKLYEIINSNVILDKEFIKLIKNKTSFFSDDIRNKTNNICILTDRERCFALEIDDDGTVIKKSSLLPDEEDEILIFSINMKEYDIKYIIKNSLEREGIYTRKEEYKIDYIKREIKKSYDKNEYDKLNYIYEEVFKEKNRNIKIVFERLLKSVLNMDSNIINKIYFILKLSSNKYIKKEI